MKVHELPEKSECWYYDGSFLGWLTIVDQAFSRGYQPFMIAREADNVFAGEWLVTDPARAHKIANRLQIRLGLENWLFLQEAFCASLPEKERLLLTAVSLGLAGAHLPQHLGDPHILALSKGCQAVRREVHAYKGFLRFQYRQEVLFGQIDPVHQVLPALCQHFSQRYPQEQVMIYDNTHQQLGIMEAGTIRYLEQVTPPDAVPEDQLADVWRTFLAAVTISERGNLDLQRSMLPLRYRGNMPEFFQPQILED